MQSSIFSFIDVDNHFEEGLARSGYSFVGGKERKKEGRKRSWKGGRKEQREGGREKGKKKGGEKEKGNQPSSPCIIHWEINSHRSKAVGHTHQLRLTLSTLHRNLHSGLSDHVTYIVKLVMKAAAGICIRNSISWSSEALFSILQETAVKA